MKTIIQIRACEVCGKSIAGRADKKFCDEWCRNAHNNSRKAAAQPLMRHINSLLAKNRTVLLAALGPATKQKHVSRDKLATEGFLFNYYTHTHLSRRGKPVFWCYDAGYKILNERNVLVLKHHAAGY